MIGMTLAVATAATITAFTLIGDWGDGDDGLKPFAEEITQTDPADEARVSDVGSGQRPVTSIDDIDPDQCNLFHNITACEGEPEPSGGQRPVTSIDDIDPDQCNRVHNIDACSPEQLGLIEAGQPEPGISTESGPVKAENTATGDLAEGEAEPEPLFVDGEPGYVVQSPAEANEMDCGLAGGTVYVTSEGEEGCLIIHDLEDSGEETVSPAQPPSVEPEPEPVDPAL